jgi:threonine/homoserine/homoserine lactone efflux protein
LLEAASFPSTNPKSWAIAIALTARFIDPDSTFTTSIDGVGNFIFVGKCYISLWNLSGQPITGALSTKESVLWFNCS